MTSRAAGIAGLCFHTAIGIWPFGTTVLAAPAWTSAVLVLWWSLLAGVALQTFRHQPALTPLMPLMALAIWGGVSAVAVTLATRMP